MTRTPSTSTTGPPVAVRLLRALVVLAAVAAVALGVLWATTLSDDARAVAQARDVVLIDARRAAVDLNSLDFRDVEAGLDLWERASTGGLLAEFRARRAEHAVLVTGSRRTTAATVSDAAVAELDLRTGTARVLVGVDVRVAVEGQEPTLVRRRLEMDMARTDAGWLAERAEVVR